MIDIPVFNAVLHGNPVEWEDNMKVILQVDVKSQGKKGQLIEVSDGYARNYLLPRKLAIEANASNMNVLKERQNAADYKKQSEITSARDIASKIKEVTVVVEAKGGTSKGRLFGSVTTKEIADALKSQFKIDIDKRKIILNEAIKTAGIYELEVKLYPDISPKLKVEVRVVPV